MYERGKSQSEASRPPTKPGMLSAPCISGALSIPEIFATVDAVMVKYLCRTCPRSNGYLGIVLRETGRNVPLQAVNGHCLGCGYRLAWIVIRGKRYPSNGSSGHLDVTIGS